MSDDDLRTVLRDFGASVSAGLAAQQRQVRGSQDEVRNRMGGLETATVNEVRAHGERTERHFERNQITLDSLDRRMDDLEAAVARIEAARGDR